MPSRAGLWPREGWVREPIICEGRVIGVLKRAYAEALREGAFPVSYACGRLLYAITRALATATQGLRAVEVGSGLGFSTIWLAAALADAGAGGVLYAIEADEERARRARENLAQAGLSGYVRLMAGDALEVLPELSGPLHLAFIDGRKDQYLAYLRLLEPKMPEGSLLLAHNAIWPPSRGVAEFLAYLSRPGLGWLTVVLPVDPAGVSLSIKMR